MNIEQILDSFALTKNTGLGASERELFEAAIRAQIIPYAEREHIAGIYFLFDKDELVYIGQSYSVLERVKTHKDTRVKIFDSFAYVKVSDYAERLMRERQLIKTYSPKYNGDLETQGYMMFVDAPECLGISEGLISHIVHKYRIPHIGRYAFHLELFQKALEEDSGKNVSVSQSANKPPTLFE